MKTLVINQLLIRHLVLFLSKRSVQCPSSLSLSRAHSLTHTHTFTHIHTTGCSGHHIMLNKCVETILNAQKCIKHTQFLCVTLSPKYRPMRVPFLFPTPPSSHPLRVLCVRVHYMQYSRKISNKICLISDMYNIKFVFLQRTRKIFMSFN